jgi:DNA repair exonuclease SbcCD nuclease subunit
MKVCLLGDTHFGIRDGSKIMHDFFELTYTDWFFDLLKEHGVDEIYQFGDLFDKRKGVDSYSIAESKRYFFNKLVEYDITMHVLVGNHDAYFKESIIINSPDQLLGNYKNIIVYDKPTTVLIGHISVDIIPWICRDNYEEVKEFVNNSHSEFCFGHFEFEGFSMYKGVMSHGGLSTAMFKKYRHVYSGHFHTRSTGGNITYLGTPCEMTWNDFNDPRGIHFFDMDNGSVTF